MTSPKCNSTPKLGDTQHSEIPEHEIESIARCLLPKIQAYFDSPEGKAAFEQWKKNNNQGVLLKRNQGQH